MDKQPAYVIIGNGIAGITAAEMLRTRSASASITMVADDPFPVYYRPALKDFLGGHLPEEKLWARPSAFYQEQRIRFVPGRVIKIQPEKHVIQLHNGQLLYYDALLLANGAYARTLDCPGTNLAGVSTLRTVADYQEILRRLERVKHVVVCGSGTLALESAETLRHAGYQVTHLLRGQQLWSEVLDSVASDMVLQEERRAGIDVRTGEEIAEISGQDGQVCGIVTTRGEYIPCDQVLIAVGIEPAIDFIRASGIACGRGVQVDNSMRTNSPDIYAAGDVVETTDALTGRTRVLGQWFPAIQQAQRAADQMLNAHLTVKPEPPAGHFYNATFLYGLDFVGLGLTTNIATRGFSELVADSEPRSYRKAVFYKGQLVGALLLGDRRQALAFKRAMDHQVNLLAIVNRLFAPDFELDAWLDQQGVPSSVLSWQSKSLATSSTESFEWTDARQASVSLENADVYLVPVPHAHVSVFMEERQLNREKQGQVITIGRQAGVSWLLEHSSISRLHAEITCGEGTYVLRDKGSSNGTFVNGSPLARESSYQLRQHDLIRFGDVQLRFELRPRASSGQGETRISLQGTALHANGSRFISQAFLDALPDMPVLVQVGPDLEPTARGLASGRRFSLGRDPQNDFVIADPSLSRRHAEIFSTPDGFFIRDLKSSYGVFVNNVKIQNTYHIAHGDRIVLGNILLYFSHPQSYASSQRAATASHATTAIVNQPVPERSIKTSAIKESEGQKAVVVGLEHRREIVPLAQSSVAFEIDMCIGCNRCMDACPLPSSTYITIAALNYATVNEKIAPNLARFTHDCIMCGSCVPVCPVDNHRDLLMLSLKQRLGVSWERPPDMQRLVHVLPSGWSPTSFIQRLREHIFLRDPQQIPDTYLLHIVALADSLVLIPGETLLREGTYGRNLYLLLDGQLELTSTDQNQTEFPVAILRRGEYLGEDGMLTGQPYKVSATAQKPTLLLQIPEQVMQQLMELVPAVREHFERFNHAHLLLAILRRMDLFKGVLESDLQMLIQSTLIRHYERNEHLFAEDTRGRPARETLHILLEGFVKVARHRFSSRGKGESSERIIAYRQSGDYFAGGLDLLGDGQAVTVTTINRCRVAEVPRQAILALFQRYPQVEQLFARRLRDYIETAAATQTRLPVVGHLQADSTVQAGFHSLVSDGVVEGTEVLVIDLDKCIHCNECEDACERRHGHSRMNRKGMVIGNISITTTCRQCADPVCMLCSRAGIARHPNGEVYITESCIGCGICAERCPYGAISIAEIAEEPVSQGAWQRFSALMTRGADKEKERTRKALPVVSPQVAGGSYAAAGPLAQPVERGGYAELRKKIAIKCDLCAGYNNQACVQACPTGAAFRVQPTSFFGSTEEILQRRAN